MAVGCQREAAGVLWRGGRGRRVAVWQAAVERRAEGAAGCRPRVAQEG